MKLIALLAVSLAFPSCGTVAKKQPPPSDCPDGFICITGHGDPPVAYKKAAEIWMHWDGEKWADGFVSASRNAK